MMKHYNTTINYFGTEITISASVSDRQEDRNYFKPSYAADLCLTWLRARGVYTNRAIWKKDMIEVSKKETVTRAETERQMKEAREKFEAMPSSTTKLVIAMKMAHGC